MEILKMKRISITFTNEMYEFLKNISEKNEVSLNETCTKIIEDFKSNKESFEKKSMNELSLNTIEIKKLTSKVSSSIELKLGEIGMINEFEYQLIKLLYLNVQNTPYFLELHLNLN